MLPQLWPPSARRRDDLLDAAARRRRRRTGRRRGKPGARRPRPPAGPCEDDAARWHDGTFAVPGRRGGDPGRRATVARRNDAVPGGIPPTWRASTWRPTAWLRAPASRLSLAVRWHGANAAVLWEVDGAPITLTATIDGPPWSTTDPRGEELWRLGRTVGTLTSAADAGPRAYTLLNERRRRCRLACGISWEGEGGHRIERDADRTSARTGRVDGQPRRRCRRQRAAVSSRRRAGHRQDPSGTGRRRRSPPPWFGGGVGAVLGGGRCARRTGRGPRCCDPSCDDAAR